MGYDYLCRIAKESKHDYNLREKRIAAMAYEAGWKACNMKRNFNK